MAGCPAADWPTSFVSLNPALHHPRPRPSPLNTPGCLSFPLTVLAPLPFARLTCCSSSTPPTFHPISQELRETPAQHSAAWLLPLALSAPPLSPLLLHSNYSNLVQAVVPVPVPVAAAPNSNRPLFVVSRCSRGPLVCPVVSPSRLSSQPRRRRLPPPPNSSLHPRRHCVFTGHPTRLVSLFSASLRLNCLSEPATWISPPPVCPSRYSLHGAAATQADPTRSFVPLVQVESSFPLYLHSAVAAAVGFIHSFFLSRL